MNRATSEDYKVTACDWYSPVSTNVKSVCTLGKSSALKLKIHVCRPPEHGKLGWVGCMDLTPVKSKGNGYPGLYVLLGLELREWITSRVSDNLSGA